MVEKVATYFSIKRKQTGQGMVEFGLVIPILLLIILGIIGFGHAFFSYTLVVAASREAARYGLATGLSSTNLPRFRDCDAIRAAAVRAGSFSGVTPERVTVWYDNGPTDTCTVPNDDGVVDPDECQSCPIGGIGPGNIEIGDRLVVSVQVNYEPIVPIGFIPEMPLKAVMRRTLIRTVPIDDQEVAPGDPCSIGTITRIIPPIWAAGGKSTSLAGDPVTFQVEVIDDIIDSNYATGTLSLFIDDDSYDSDIAFCSKPVDGTTNIIACDPILIWTDPLITHTIRAMFEPTPSSCYKPSKAEPITHQLNLVPLP